MAFSSTVYFFKTLPLGSLALDVGGGSGGLVFWKEYGTPKRSDLKLYGISDKKGEYFDLYEDYQIGNIDEVNFKWQEEIFDAAIISHVIEHLKNPKNLLDNLNRVLKQRSFIYVEYPSKHTYYLPLKDDFGKLGIKPVITNFYEDKTHVKTYDINELYNLFQLYNFELISYGTIFNPYLEDILWKIAISKLNNDEEICTYACWNKLKFAEYAIFSKKSIILEVKEFLLNIGML